MNELVCVYDDLQDRLYEIDRSWQNNLVFHGIKPDAGGVYESTDCLEAKIKGVLRTNLNIGREIPIVRLQRIFNGSDVRGYKPVVVNFQVSHKRKEEKATPIYTISTCKHTLVKKSFVQGSSSNDVVGLESLGTFQGQIHLQAM